MHLEFWGKWLKQITVLNGGHADDDLYTNTHMHFAKSNLINDGAVTVPTTCTPANDERSSWV